MTLSAYSWEDVHRYFPQEVIEQYRKKIIEEWKSGKFKDREIWEHYGMSENAFYDLIKRYSEDESLKDKPSKPKNPAHKLSQEAMQNIINKAHEDREKIKTLQSAFETDMKKDGGSLSPKKLERLKDLMIRAIPGVRRIANWFNGYMQNLGKDMSIGKSRVHEILASVSIFEKEKKIEKKPKHLNRPEKPLASFLWTLPKKESVMGILDTFSVFLTCTMMPL